MWGGNSALVEEANFHQRRGKNLEESRPGRH